MITAFHKNFNHACNNAMRCDHVWARVPGWIFSKTLRQDCHLTVNEEE